MKPAGDAGPLISDTDRRPLFLERDSYRQRRMMDALRILPVLGMMLWMLPVFWPHASSLNNPEASVAVSTAIIYVFGIWAFLILAAAALWLILRDRLTSDLPERDNGS